jgi:hypothetical protein
VSHSPNKRTKKPERSEARGRRLTGKSSSDRRIKDLRGQELGIRADW